MAGVLENIRVLDLSWGIAGPMTTMLMADHGAAVTKIEPPGGENIRTRSDDGFPPQVQLLNPGKRGVVLDLKDDRGKEALVDLADD
jgi:crotonobetainyl-CoA:carnitine CoA-transferase CaiB-like acyl-CoA transferase